MSKLNILQGTTIQYYHEIPTELSLVTVSPERSAIFQYLSQIGEDQFVQFVADLLVHVERHKLIDITDGPGDEKQDIVTELPDGTRQLTQCKHTINYKDNSTGDELDYLFAACFRKNCSSGLYVTNADLTPQAKRYVTDKEYVRGWKGGQPVPLLDYWNGSRIWERVARSDQILNKWFGGMAQGHGLRAFFFDAIVCKMPGGAVDTVHAEDIAQALTGSAVSLGNASDQGFQVKLDNELSLILSDWFRGTHDLGIAYLHPRGEIYDSNVPLHSIRVQVALLAKVIGYDPAKYRDRVASILSDALPQGPDWWHVLITAPQAFVFLQDISKPVLVGISDPNTYVRVGVGPSVAEREWAGVPGEQFHRVEVDDSVHFQAIKSGVTLQILCEQRIHAVEAHELALRHEHAVRLLESYELREVNGATADVTDMIRRLTRPDWFVLQSDSGDVLWGFPEDVTKEDVNHVENALQRNEIQFHSVGEDRKAEVLQLLGASSPIPTGNKIVEVEDCAPPIDLRARIFWLTGDRRLDLPERLSLDLMLSLLRFKAEYEQRFGYDMLNGKDHKKIASEELRRLLFDPFTYRGTRMLDIALEANSVSISLRCREGSISSASELAAKYLTEFLSIADALAALCLDRPKPLKIRP